MRLILVHLGLQIHHIAQAIHLALIQGKQAVLKALRLAAQLFNQLLVIGFFALRLAHQLLRQLLGLVEHFLSHNLGAVNGVVGLGLRLGNNGLGSVLLLLGKVGGIGAGLGHHLVRFFFGVRHRLLRGGCACAKLLLCLFLGVLGNAIRHLLGGDQCGLDRVFFISVLLNLAGKYFHFAVKLFVLIVHSLVRLDDLGQQGIDLFLIISAALHGRQIFLSNLAGCNHILSPSLLT